VKLAEPPSPVRLVIVKTKCNLFIMLLERLLEVQSLSVEDKWRLIDELWSDLAREVERAGANQNTLALLNQRFEEYLQDPDQGRPLDVCLAHYTCPNFPGHSNIYQSHGSTGNFQVPRVTLTGKRLIADHCYEEKKCRRNFL
jgi:hypothetical protein